MHQGTQWERPPATRPAPRATALLQEQRTERPTERPTAEQLSPRVWRQPRWVSEPGSCYCTPSTQPERAERQAPQSDTSPTPDARWIPRDETRSGSGSGTSAAAIATTPPRDAGTRTTGTRAAPGARAESRPGPCARPRRASLSPPARSARGLPSPGLPQNWRDATGTPARPADPSG